MEGVVSTVPSVAFFFDICAGWKPTILRDAGISGGGRSYGETSERGNSDDASGESYGCRLVDLERAVLICLLSLCG